MLQRYLCRHENHYFISSKFETGAEAIEEFTILCSLFGEHITCVPIGKRQWKYLSRDEQIDLLNQLEDIVLI